MTQQSLPMVAHFGKSDGGTPDGGKSDRGTPDGATPDGGNPGSSRGRGATESPVALGSSPGSPGSDDDVFWVARARQGDQDAFRRLVELHGRTLFRLAYRMTGREDLADDVVQEAFLEAYRALPRFEGRSRFATWLHRIAANRALDLLRRQKGREARLGDSLAVDDGIAEPPSEAPGPERLVLSGEIGSRVERALESLTPIERTAFVLRHFENRSIAEIGRALGSRTNATKQAVFRAVRKLRQQLEPLIEPPTPEPPTPEPSGPEGKNHVDDL
jgi:RNA polymerase sigma-70 factor (ECF subfamily)